MHTMPKAKMDAEMKAFAADVLASIGQAKQAVTVRYSPDVLQAFRASGAGWQARMNDALKEWLQTHSPV
jgi:uncharacterized protein (DUF4415 family)